jgi:carbonyl reductase 1
MKFSAFFALFFMMKTLVAQVNSLASASERRIALVTGANKGIGKEIAKKLANDASIVPILACRTNGKETAAELGCEHAVFLDLTDDASIAACRQYIDKHFNGKLDILVNNAAICFNDPTLYGKVKHTPFQEQAAITISTNYFGTRKLTDALLPCLERSSAPRVINIASYAGRLGILKSQEKVEAFTNPDLTTEQLDAYLHDFVKAVENGTHAQEGWPNTCYGMSKLGIIALTRLLARDFPKMRVNSVDPGYCATDQNQMQGNRPAERGAVTPYLLATTNEIFSGMHWFDEKEMQWSY